MKFTTFYLIFLLFSIINRLRMRRRILSGKMESGEVYVRWSLSLLTYGYILIVAATVSEYFILQRKISYAVTISGLLVYLLGLFGRKWPVKILAKYWSPHVEIRENQRLIKEGLYRYLRHPYYLSLLIEVLGFTLIPNAYYTFLVALIVYTSIIYIRIHYEEQALIEKFGQEYLDYRKEVPALIPLKFRRAK